MIIYQEFIPDPDLIKGASFVLAIITLIYWKSLLTRDHSTSRKSDCFVGLLLIFVTVSLSASAYIIENLLGVP